MTKKTDFNLEAELDSAYIVKDYSKKKAIDTRDGILYFVRGENDSLEKSILKMKNLTRNVRTENYLDENHAIDEYKDQSGVLIFGDKIHFILHKHHNIFLSQRIVSPGVRFYEMSTHDVHSIIAQYDTQTARKIKLEQLESAAQNN